MYLGSCGIIRIDYGPKFIGRIDHEISLFIQDKGLNDLLATTMRTVSSIFNRPFHYLPILVWSLDYLISHSTV